MKDKADLDKVQLYQMFELFLESLGSLRGLGVIVVMLSADSQSAFLSKGLNDDGIRAALEEGLVRIKRPIIVAPTPRD